MWWLNSVEYCWGILGSTDSRPASSLLPLFPCSTHNKRKPEAQTWNMGWGGNKGTKLTLKKNILQKPLSFCVYFHLVILCIFLLSLHICLLIFASSVLGVALNGTFQVYFPTTHLFTSNNFFNPLLSLPEPSIFTGKKNKLLSVADCVCSPALWLGDLTPWAGSP